MSFAYHSYTLVCHSYIIRMSLVCGFTKNLLKQKYVLLMVKAQETVEICNLKRVKQKQKTKKCSSGKVDQHKRTRKWKERNKTKYEQLKKEKKQKKKDKKKKKLHTHTNSLSLFYHPSNSLHNAFPREYLFLLFFRTYF